MMYYCWKLKFFAPCVFITIQIRHNCLLFFFLFHLIKFYEFPIHLIPNGFFVVVILQDVSGQVVLITGGGGGVGAHLARNFGKLNAKVVIWDVNNEGERDHRISEWKQKSPYPVFFIDNRNSPFK